MTIPPKKPGSGGKKRKHRTSSKKPRVKIKKKPKKRRKKKTASSDPGKRVRIVVEDSHDRVDLNDSAGRREDSENLVPVRKKVGKVYMLPEKKKPTNNQPKKKSVKQPKKKKAAPSFFAWGTTFQSWIGSLF